MKIEIVDILEQFAVDVVDNLVSSFIGSPQPLIRATHERAVELPRDTYAHEDVQTEWWYYTGHLYSGDRPFGFELVFFKRRTDLDRFGKIVPMRILGSVNYYAHFAVTDISDKKFRYFHKRSINGSSPAGATTDRYKVWLDNWSAKEINGLHMLSAQMNQTKLELVLKPLKPIVKHGINGLSFKDEGEASYYLAYTRMEAEGELTIGGKEFPVKGSAWMDHEFGSWTMKQKIQGWDWFALQLDNNYEIMAYHIRDIDGHPTRYSEASIVDPEGNSHRLSINTYSITPLGDWKSSLTGTVYPSGWLLEIPSMQTELRIEPVLKCQELDTRGSTMIIYWEGASTVEGVFQGKPIKGRSYIELVGYDRSHENLTIFDFFMSEIRYRSIGM